MKGRIATCFFLILSAALPAFSEILSQEGEGFLETQNGQLILHLQGSSYERGYQHGALLKSQIQHNISNYIDKPKGMFAERLEDFFKNLPILLSYVPEHFIDEMRGMADASEIPQNKILLLNLFPEMFHCSGMTVSDQATKNGDLYHVRVLDFAVGKSLQNTAVLQVVKPDHGIAFLNVSYAGFIGSVTGMNREQIAIGEIGGLGYGSWKGIPMAFLLREVLQNAGSIEEAKAILQLFPRTCEYYYVFSDGKTNESIGVYATASQLQFFTPGASYALLSPSNLPENYGLNGENDKFVLTPCSIETTPSQTLLFEADNKVAMLFRQQPAHCLLLTGFSHPERYPVLVERVLNQYGKLDVSALINLIKSPVSRDSNLHNAIFKPSELKVWIAHAGPNDEPACDQPYYSWDLNTLLEE